MTTGGTGSWRKYGVDLLGSKRRGEGFRLETQKRSFGNQQKYLPKGRQRLATRRDRCLQGGGRGISRGQFGGKPRAYVVSLKKARPKRRQTRQPGPLDRDALKKKKSEGRNRLQRGRPGWLPPVEPRSKKEFASVWGGPVRSTFLRSRRKALVVAYTIRKKGCFDAQRGRQKRKEGRLQGRIYGTRTTGEENVAHNHKTWRKKKLTSGRCIWLRRD